MDKGPQDALVQSPSGGKDENGEHDPQHNNGYLGSLMQWWKPYTKAQESTRPGWHDYPNGKAATMYWHCGGEGEVAKEAPFYHRLQFDLANSYYWSGDQCIDMLYFYMQWHPILGLFLSHPNHPWSKKLRLVQLVLSMLFSLPATAAIAAITETDREDSSVLLGKVADKILTLSLITLPNCIVGVVLYQCSVAGAACPSCRLLCECLHNCCACLMFVLACCACSVAIAFLSAKPNIVDAFWPLLMGLVWYWLLWFPLWLFVPGQLGFFSLWRVESAKARSLLEAA